VPPLRLSDEEFDKLLQEKDPFRLAILGHSAIEADIDAAIHEAFDGHVPPELAKARFQIKIALAVALGLLPAQERPLFDRLATLRNKFAHGEIHVLTRQHANTLVDDMPKSVSSVDEEWDKQLRPFLQKSEPTMSLRFALRFARGLFAGTVAIARKQREEERQAVAAKRRGRAAREAALRAFAEVGDAQAAEITLTSENAEGEKR